MENNKEQPKNIRTVLTKFVNNLKNIRTIVRDNWAFYVFIKTIFMFVFGVFLTFFLIRDLRLMFLIGFLPSLPFYYLDIGRRKVAKENPLAYLEMNSWETFSIFFAGIVVICLYAILAITFLTNSGVSNFVLDSIALLFALIFFFGFGGFILGFQLLIETAIGMRAFEQNENSNTAFSLLQTYYVDEKLEIRAKLFYLLRLLSSGKINEKRKKLGYFRDVLKKYNMLLKRKYDFAIKNIEEVYKPFLLTVLLGEPNALPDIKNRINSLIKSIDVQEDNPLEFWNKVKDVVSVNSKICEMCKEVEIEPERIRKTIRTHWQSIGMILGLIIGVIGILLTLFFDTPIII